MTLALNSSAQMNGGFAAPPGLQAVSPQPTAGQGVSQLAWDQPMWIPTSSLSEVLETAILHHFDVLQAANPLGGPHAADRLVGLHPKNQQQSSR